MLNRFDSSVYCVVGVTRSDASESLARVDDSDLSGFTILEESVDSGGSGGGENGGDDGDDDDDDDKDRLSDSDAHDRFKALLNDVDDLLKAKVLGTCAVCVHLVGSLRVRPAGLNGQRVVRGVFYHMHDAIFVHIQTTISARGLTEVLPFIMLPSLILMVFHLGLICAQPEATTSDPLPEEGSTHSSNSSQLPPISDASSKAPESSEGGGDVAALVAAAETEALRAELLAVKSAAAMERAAHDQRVLRRRK